MPYSVHNETQLSTVTAVALVRGFVLAGEGPFLKIYSSNRQSVPVLVERCFDDHSVHGIIALQWSNDQLLVLLWGGLYVRVLLLSIPVGATSIKTISSASLSCADWILHASYAPLSPGDDRLANFALITAHNALVELTVSIKSPAASDITDDGLPEIHLSTSDLSMATRCTLYTAHVHWLTEAHVLVASGTAFGEIIIWSCVIDRIAQSGTPYQLQVHHVFTAHEGSVFGLDVLHAAARTDGSRARLLVASCSDDRTIRIWDASHALKPDKVNGISVFSGQPAGVSNEGADSTYPVPPQIAQGWAHTSRIWHVAFLPGTEDPSCASNTVELVSIGEDATYQHWSLKEVPNPSVDSTTAVLTHIETFSNHAGKNIWSYGLLENKNGRTQLVTGGADGTIAISELQNNSSDIQTGLSARYEWQFDSLKIDSSEPEPSVTHANPLDEKDISPKVVNGELVIEKKTKSKKKKSKASLLAGPKNGFKTYDLLDVKTLLLTTQRGELVLGTMFDRESEDDHETDVDGIQWRVLERYANLAGYSMIQCLPECGLAFFTGTDGVIYCYNHGSSTVSTVCGVGGRVASLFAQTLASQTATVSSRTSPEQILLVVTRLGQSAAHIFRWTVDGECILRPTSAQSVVNIPENFIATAALVVHGPDSHLVLFLGSREGEVIQFSLVKSQEPIDVNQQWSCHSDTITGFHWIGKEARTGCDGYLITTGRDFSYAITKVDVTRGSHELTSRLPLPFGPYVEGLEIRDFDQHLIFYGFQSKYFVVYDETAQRELMRVDCGGAHRSWSFHLTHASQEPTVGTFVWTQASNLCKYSALRHVQTVIKQGGHGREIKACAVSPTCPLEDRTEQLIATGAEDTDIRLLTYKPGLEESLSELSCHTVIRKHNTGLQGLQWSANGRYLFSCAGCEEFYVWRISSVPLAKIGVVCLGAMPTDVIAGQVPEQRITNFEAIEVDSHKEGEDLFMVSLVLSDSSLRIYRLSCSADNLTWDLVFKGGYTSACLTLCQFLGRDVSSNVSCLVTGSTDGYLAIWDLENPQANDGKLQPIHVQRVHQSSIKCLTMVRLQDKPSSFLIFTGGDDNALAVTRVDLAHDIHSSTLLLPRAHAAAVTAVTVLPQQPFTPTEYSVTESSSMPTSSPLTFTILTTSNDQRVKTWDFTVDVEADGIGGIEVTKTSSSYTQVADASCVALMSHRSTPPQIPMSGQPGVVVCGVGIDIWRARQRG